MNVFIRKQSKKIIVILSIIMLLMVGIPIFSLAVDNKAPEVSVDKKGRIKVGTDITYTITDDSTISAIYYAWDRHSGGEMQVLSNLNLTAPYTKTIKLPFSKEQLGVHEFSIAALDSNGNIGNWLDVAYNVVNEDVPENYVDGDKVKFIIDTQSGAYPVSRSTINLKTPVTIGMEDDNGIYVLAYKWVKELCNNYDYVYNPGNTYTFYAPTEPGEWYIQFFCVDGSGLTSDLCWSKYTVKDTESPKLTLKDGKSEIEVLINSEYKDTGAVWTDNDPKATSGEVSATNTLDTTKEGTQYLEYTYTDGGGNTTTIKRTVHVVNPVSKIEMATLPKVQYTYGETIDVTGGKVKIIHLSGKETEIDLTKEMLTKYNEHQTGKQTIEVSYTDNKNVVHKTEFEITINIPKPEKVSATYGDKLLNVKLPAGFTIDANQYNEEVVLNEIGTKEFLAVYTPQDTNFAPISTKATIEVLAKAINDKNITVNIVSSINEGDTLIYNTKEQVPQITKVILSENEKTTELDATKDYTISISYAIKDASGKYGNYTQTKPVNAGTYKAKVVVTGINNYSNEVTKVIEYTITDKCIVTFYDGDKVLGTHRDILVGTTIPANKIPNTNKEGTDTIAYKFIGWYKNSELTQEFNMENDVITTNTNIYAKYDKVEGQAYTVIFEAEGKTVKTVKSIIANDYKVELPVNPSKTGHTFAGWFYTVNETEKEVTANTQIKDNVTVVAKFTPNKYTVTLELNDGTLLQENNITEYTYGTEVILPTPTKTGHTFAGWFNNSACTGTAVTKIGATETENKTYYAKFEKNTYQISFNVNEGTIKDTNYKTTYQYGDTVTLPINVTKTGYTFEGWFNDAEFTGTAVTEIISTDIGNKTYFAKWTPNANTAYTVEHYKENVNLNGYSKADTENLTGTTGATVTATAKTYEGYALKQDSVLTGTVAADGSLVIKVYYDLVIYTVTFEAEGAQAVQKTTNVTKGYKVELPANPTKTGHTFEGWFISETEQITADTQIKNNVTATAHFTPNTYTVKLNVNDGTLAEGTNITEYTYGTETTLPTPEKVGYTFAGWFNNSKFTGTAVTEITVADIGNKEFFAKWIPNTDTVYKVEHYTQKLDKTGYDLTETEEKSGTTETSVSATAKTYKGFTINLDVEGTIKNGTITSDGKLVLKLYYDRNTYKITLNANGGTIADGTTQVDYIYGAETILPTPTKEGYTFAGWFYTVNETETEFTATTEITEATTVTAKWTPNTNTAYTVEHYKQNADLKGYSKVEADTENLTGTTGAKATANGKTYNGFTLNLDVTGTVKEGTIAADGTLVLKLYYDRNTYKVTLDANGGTIADGTTQVNYIYGAETILPIPTKEGYTFAGWFYTVNETETEFTATTEITEATTVTAKWTPNTDTVYTVKHYKQNADLTGYDKVNVEVENLTGTTGATVTATAKTYEGYTLKQDSVLTGTVAADGSLVIEVYYDLVIYTVTFNTEGAQTVEKTTNVTKGYKVGLPANPSKTGHTFDKWVYELEGVETEFTAETVVTTNTVVTPKFKANKYTVKLNLDNGTLAEGTNITEYTYGTETTLPTPTKTGYTFAGWFNNSTFTGTAVTKITVADIENKEFFAKWIPNTGTAYTVEHYTQNVDLKGYSKVEAETESLAGTTGAKATANGKTFTGFTLNLDVEGTVKEGTISADGTLVLKLYYDRNTYKVTLDVNGGIIANGTTQVDYIYGRQTLLPTPTKEGYTFAGWFYTVNETETEFTAITEITQATTVTAKWTANTNTAYTVKHYKQNADLIGYDKTNAEVENLTAVTGATVTAEAKTYEGYALKQDSVLTGTVAADGSLVIEVYYDLVMYTVIFEAEGTTAIQKTTNVTKGYKVELPANPTKTGHTFAGWFISDTEKITEDTQIKNNVTATARFTPNTYAVKLNLDNGTLAEGTNITEYTYGTETTLPTPTKTGYTFAGWFNSSAFTGTVVTKITVADIGNKEFFAKWTPNIYTVTFEANNGTKATTQSINYNDTATKPTDPEKTADAQYTYTFAGWFTTQNFTQGTEYNFETPVTENVTLYAKYDTTANEYKVTLNVNGGTIAEGKDITKYTFGIGATLPTEIEKEGYIFAGWFTDAKFTKTAVTEITATETGDKTYYAKWIMIPKDLKATYGDKLFDVVLPEDFEFDKTVYNENTTVGNAGTNEFLVVYKPLNISGVKVQIAVSPKVLNAENTTIETNIQSGEKLTYNTLEQPIEVTNVTFKEGTEAAEGTKLNGPDQTDKPADYEVSIQYARKDTKKEDGTLTYGEYSDAKPVNAESYKARIIITGTGNYAKSVTKVVYYTITGKVLNTENTTIETNIQSGAKLTYNTFEQPVEVTNVTYTEGTEGTKLNGPDQTDKPVDYKVSILYAAKNVKKEDGTLTYGEYSDAKPVNAGTYKVRIVVTGTGNYAKSVAKTMTYTITGKVLNAENTTIETNIQSGEKLTYNTLEQPIEVTNVTFKEGTEAAEGTKLNGPDQTDKPADYEVSIQYARKDTKKEDGTLTYGEYSDAKPVNAESYKARIIVTGTGNYAKSVSKVVYYTITPITLNKENTTIETNIQSGAKLIYEENKKQEVQETKVIFTDGEKTTEIYKPADYEVSIQYATKDTKKEDGTLTYGDYSDTKPENAGSYKARIIVTGTGNYAKSVSKVVYYTIVGRYSVIFKVEDETLTTLIAEEKNKFKVNVPEAPEKEGYHFVGWFTENNDKFTSDTVVSANTTLKAQYNPNEYSVKLNVNGGALAEESNITKYTYGTEVTLPTPTRIGYTFAGWFIGTETEATEKITSTDIGDKEFSAKWTANENTAYTVEYYKQNLDGTYALAETIPAAGTTDTKATANEKTYDGFTLNLNAEGTVKEGNIAGNGSLVLKLYYDRNKYTVTLNVNGGALAEESNITKYTYGTEVTLPTPTRIGYTFAGWFNGTETEATEKITSTDIGDKEFSAKWTANENTAYTVEHYKQNLDGTYALAETIPATGTTDTKVTATSNSKTYDGFTLNLNVEGTVAEGNIAGNGTLVLKLYYDRNKYQVTLDANGGTIADSIAKVEYVYGKETVLPTPTKEGYTFEGWFYTVNETETEFTATTQITQATTVTAKWTIKTYTVTFNPGEGTVTPETTNVNHGDTMYSLPTPTREGYTFEGWFVNDTTEFTTETPVINNITVTAKWAIKTYTVTFEAEGTETVQKTTNVTEGYKVQLPEAPTKPGNTFAGWFYTVEGVKTEFTAETVVTKNITVTAEFTEKIVITKIEVENPPKTVKYGTNLKFSLTVTMNKGTTTTTTYVDSTECKITGYDSKKVLEKQTVTVTYGGKTTTFDVIVEDGIAGIRIINDKTNYNFGEKIDKSKITVMTVMASGKDIEDVTSDSNIIAPERATTAGNMDITVKYGEYTETTTINVKKAVIYFKSEGKGEKDILKAGIYETYMTLLWEGEVKGILDSEEVDSGVAVYQGEHTIAVGGTEITFSIVYPTKETIEDYCTFTTLEDGTFKIDFKQDKISNISEIYLSTSDDEIAATTDEEIQEFIAENSHITVPGTYTLEIYTKNNTSVVKNNIVVENLSQE